MTEKHFCDRCNKEMGKEDHLYNKLETRHEFRDGDNYYDNKYEYCGECWKLIILAVRDKVTL